jgi:CRP-like cAMP-binding protein
MLITFYFNVFFINTRLTYAIELNCRLFDNWGSIMPSQTHYEQLANNPWFAALPPVDIEKLVLLCKVKNLKKGEQLLAKNAPAQGLFCVLTGKIKVSNVNQNGKELVLTWLSPGTWFGEISLFDGLPRTHDSFAETDSSLLMLPAAAFQQLLVEHPELYPHFIRQLCQRIRTLFSLLDETTGLGLKQRLAKRLLTLSKGWGGIVNSQSANSSIEPRNTLLNTSTETNLVPEDEEITISQESLASMLNSSRQTINKLLQELKNEQLIDIRYGKIVLLKPQDLRLLGEL